MFGNLEEQQKAMKSRLSQITVESEAGDGAVKVTANGNQQILNVSINRAALDWEDVAQVEDLVTVAVNRALMLSQEKASEEAQKMLREMLPPGMGNFGNLFG
jgi:hypothetical protein